MAFKRQYLHSAKIHLEKIVGVEQQIRYLKDKVDVVFDHRIITKKIRNALATGNWTNSKGESMRLGVSQQLKRETNHFSTLSYMRKCCAPVPSKSKMTQPRLLHNTHYGFFCPC